ncbi:MAG: aspartate aminotransferase family protein [Candidatus Omnitrophica bacterium]|nr:aspartate aminotransferase family protein [Candidatus Omnitrophota bacterium]
MTKKEIFENYDQFIFPTYTRMPVILVKGKGSVVTDIDGKKYLDFFPGWGVSNVGHCHPKVMAAVRDQIGKMIHVPNNFFHPNQARLAREIVNQTFPGKVFFCNSGAEANEAAIKFARIYGEGRRFEIITTLNSFHGRTLGALAATGQTKYQNGFQPLPGGFKTVPFNDIDALKFAITDKTVAIMLELIQGEGGINIASKEYVQEVRRICDEKNILLILDEVQTGIGRTGAMFAYKHFSVEPDVLTMAKGLGGGMPIGAMLAKKSIAHILKPGMHGTTFGGSPIVTKAAIGVFEAIAKEKMLKNARDMGEYLVRKLTELSHEFSFILEVRGLGLMIGVELSIEGKPVFDECLSQGLIINCTQGKVLRIMPALNITKKQADKALLILRNALQKVALS